MKIKLKFYKKLKKLPKWCFVPAALILKGLKMFFMRVYIIDPHKYLKIENMPFITVTWHNRLLYLPLMSKKKYREKTYALVSSSRDGQYVSDLIKLFGVRSIRGSSSKLGLAALNKAVDALNNGNNISITPDGPRGPKYSMSKGPILMASKTGCPILPVTVNASRYWALKSWDNFRIPKPFCKISLVVGEYIKIPPNLTKVEIEKWCLYVQGKLMIIS
ncbi:MAG: lysophospholipid acyltransferase family protein [bacterium]|nr:lysophospholipid acyltransferase family protein [bacterium]